MDDDIQDHVSMGIQQIEGIIRHEDLGTASSAFELTASVLAVHADRIQMARLLRLAVALEFGEASLDGHPLSEVGAAKPSLFRPH